MNRALLLTAAVLAFGAAGCNSGGDAPPANVSANASSEALENAAAAGNEAEIAAAAAPDNAAAGNGAGAASPCGFAPGDVKDWKAVQGKDGTRTAGMIIVTGKARVADPKYMAKLDKTGVEGGTLSLALTRADQEFPDEAPGDGWYDLRYGPGESGVAKVALWCDRETRLAELDVEGAK
ncbi:MAG: hypothetical protein ABWX67_16975 [Allosphingosinicella sp.]